MGQTVMWVPLMLDDVGFDLAEDQAARGDDAVDDVVDDDKEADGDASLRSTATSATASSTPAA